MRITILGGTRGIGMEVVRQSLEADCDVTVLARNQTGVTLEHDHLRVLVGDATNGDDIQRAVDGADVIISCLGCPITFSPVSLFSTAAHHLVSHASEKQKIITVTGIGAGDSAGHGGFLYDALFKPIFLRTIYRDKDREEAILLNSSLTTMIVRPAGLTNGKKTEKYAVYTDLTGVTSRRISRRDVAHFLVSQATAKEHSPYWNKAVLLSY